jgi:hypothetical protein
VSGKVKVVKKGDFIKNQETNDPKIAIGSSADHKKSSITFYVTFDGAMWAGPKSGNFYTGVNYNVEDINRLCVQVDKNKFDMAKRVMTIPLNIKITGGGDITATVEGNGTSVSDKTVVIAKSVDGVVGLGSNSDGVKANEYCELNPVYISDTSTQVFKAGTKFRVSVDSSFYFTNTGTVTATGKFADKCSFEIDASDKSVGYIKINEDTTAEAGKVSVSGLVLKRDVTGAFKVIMMEISGSGIESYSRSFAVANYDSSYTYTPTTTTNAEAATEETTQAVKKTVVMNINSDKYQSNGAVKSCYSPVKITKLHTVMPVELFRAVYDVKNEDFKTDGSTAEIKIGEKTVVFKAGSSTMTINGQGVEMGYAAESENGIIYVPLASVFKAMGVATEDIIFNSTDKTVTLYIR